MKKFDLKEHNTKVFELSKNAARGVYPSKRVAKDCDFQCVEFKAYESIK